MAGWLAAFRSFRQAPDIGKRLQAVVGRLKTELFYPRDWKTTTVEQFIQLVDSYIRWCNEERIKISLGSLGSLGPIEYRESLGFAT